MPPHPREGRKLLGHLWGPHTHLHKAHSAFPTRYSTVGLNCAAPFGCRTVWCARHPQQLGPQWGIGAMPPHPGMEGHCLVTLGGTQTPQRPHSALPTPCIRRFELRFGCHTVVWTPSSAARVAMGHGGNATTSQGWQDTACSPWGGTHTPPQPHSALPTPYPTVSNYGLG